MKPKHKQKQFTKQFELDVEILKLRRLAERKEAKAKDHDKAFHQYELMSTDPEVSPNICQFNAERACYFKKKAATLRFQINGITERRIPRLVQAKAELQTIPLAFMPKDCGVAA